MSTEQVKKGLNIQKIEQKSYYIGIGRRKTVKNSNIFQKLEKSSVNWVRTLCSWSKILFEEKNRPQKPPSSKNDSPPLKLAVLGI